ncbi:MAG: hypothetical protein NUW37_16010 [Planctomycetes bacterium]|nr:hypothetical protein [Planctomycetota bacterium]
MPERFGAIVGTLSFLVVLVAGLVRKAELSDTLLKALLFLPIFTLIGYIIARIGAVVIGEKIQEEESPTVPGSEEKPDMPTTSGNKAPETL